MDTESDIRAELASLRLRDVPVDETDNTPMSFNNASMSFHTHPIDLPNTSHRKSPSDFSVPALDHVDRTRVEYVPLTRTQRDFSKETPSIETSPRLAMTARTDRSSPSLMISTSRMMKANTVNLSSVSSASVNSLPLAALTRIMERRKDGHISANTTRSGEKSYYQDLSSPIYERTQRWRTSSTSRLNGIKTQNLEKEIAECSFAPVLAPKTQLFLPTESVELRTQRWKDDAEKKVQQEKARMEEEIASDCTFQPTVLRADSQKTKFDGKKFYARNVDWQRRVLNKAKGVYEPVQPTASPPVKVVKRIAPQSPKSPFVLQESSKDQKEMNELEEFKIHAASLSRILKGSSEAPVARSAPNSANRIRLKTEAVGRKEIRQELLAAKIALLEMKVTAALKASPRSSKDA